MIKIALLIEPCIIQHHHSQKIYDYTDDSNASINNYQFDTKESSRQRFPKDSPKIEFQSSAEDINYSFIYYQ